MDRASQVLAQGVPPGVPRSYRALADHGNVSHSTLHHRAHGRPSMEEKAEANSTSNHMKKMLSLSICYKCPTLDSQYE